MKTINEILAENLHRLKKWRDEGGYDVLEKKLNDETGGEGLGHSTIGRMFGAKGNTKIDSVEVMAKHYGLKAWQMLVEDLDPERPPEAEMEASRPAKLIAKRFDKLLTNEEARRKAYAIILQVIELGAEDLDGANEALSKAREDHPPPIVANGRLLAHEPKPLQGPKK